MVKPRDPINLGPWRKSLLTGRDTSKWTKVNVNQTNQRDRSRRLMAGLKNTQVCTKSEFIETRRQLVHNQMYIFEQMALQRTVLF
jgi:hypothetical protein